MDLQTRIISEIRKRLNNKKDVADYLEVSVPTLNKILKKEKVSKFTISHVKEKLGI